MTTHSIEIYKDTTGDHRWRIVSNKNKKILADSGEGYKNRRDMLNSLFGIFFCDFDDSFLTLYQEWNPNGDNGQPIDPPSVAEQAGTESEYPDGRVGVPAPDGVHDGGVTDDD